MKKIIGNFKMNKTNSAIKDYLLKFLAKVDVSRAEVVLCLPYSALTLGEYLMKNSGVKLGAQNLCDEEEGKNTGEISGAMLKDCGCEYVIIGHSERRAKYRESSKMINKKIKIALKNRLKVILCVGESALERKGLKTNEVLKAQVEESLKGLYENELENILIAYEPIWAIGTGKVPQVKEIDGAVKVIKKTIGIDFSQKASEKIEVLYGGSVDNKNCQTLTKIKGVSGLLVGGACLDEANFCQIIKDIKVD